MGADGSSFSLAPRAPIHMVSNNNRWCSAPRTIMTPGPMKDANGSTLSLARQVPGWGYKISVTSKDGTVASYDASPADLATLASAFAQAASTPERLAAAHALKANG